VPGGEEAGGAPPLGGPGEDGGEEKAEHDRGEQARPGPDDAMGEQQGMETSSPGDHRLPDDPAKRKRCQAIRAGRPRRDRLETVPARRGRDRLVAGALLAAEDLTHGVAAELRTLDDRVADTGEHLLEARAHLTAADLLGSGLYPLGGLVDLGLVGGAGRAHA